MKNIYKTILFAVAVLMTQSKNTCAQIVYSNDFESGAVGWTVGNSLKTCDGYFSRSSSWAITNTTGGVAFSLGSNTMGTINDGTDGAENGWITSPNIFVTSSTLVVDLDSWVGNEPGFPCYYDTEFIEISTDGGASFYPIHGFVVGIHDVSNDMTWRHFTFTTAVTANTNIKLRLRLDTGDGCCGQTSRGWFVDNLVLTSFAPVAIAFEFNSTNVACNGGSDGSITFAGLTGGTAPYQYSIDGGVTYQGSPVFTGLSAGTYHLKAKDVNGVESTSSATVTLSQPESPLVANAGFNQTVYYGYGSNSCANLDGTASGGTPEYSYAWSNGDSSASTSVCPTATQSYTLTVTDARGCFAQSVTTVCVINVKCSRGGNAVIIGQGDKVLVCHKTSNNHTVTICVSANAVPAHLAHGDNLGSCNDTSCFNFSSRSSAEEETATISSEPQAAFAIYPNPNNGTFTIQSDADGSYIIFDGLGQPAVNVQLNAANNHTIKVDHLKPGHYFISGTSNGRVVNEKIVVTQ